MRQPSIILLLICLALVLPSFGAAKGGADYSIPTDYSKLSETETEFRARVYYYNATRLEDGAINEDTTNALNLYKILQEINPHNVSYCVKLGVLYDKLNMDKLAKSNFSRGIGIDSSNPEPYFYLGDFYFKRQMYRKALKYYQQAVDKGGEVSPNIEIINRMFGKK